MAKSPITKPSYLNLKFLQNIKTELCFSNKYFDEHRIDSLTINQPTRESSKMQIYPFKLWKNNGSNFCTPQIINWIPKGECKNQVHYIENQFLRIIYLFLLSKKKYYFYFTKIIRKQQYLYETDDCERDIFVQKSFNSKHRPSNYVPRREKIHPSGTNQLAKVLCGTVVIQNALLFFGLLRTKYGHKTLLSVPIYLSNFDIRVFQKIIYTSQLIMFK